MPEFRLDNFAKGKTDYYINGPINAAEEIDNFLIDRNGKPNLRFGSTIYNSDYYQIPAGNQRIGNLHYYDGVLFQQSARNIYYTGALSWVTITGPVNNNPFFAAGTVTSNTCYAEWNGHVFWCIDNYTKPRKLYKDGSGVWQVRTAGLPDLASNPTITPDFDDGASYIYGFYYEYTYSVGTVSYLDRGPITLVSVANGGDLSGVGHYNQISVIPAITNGTTECYDTATIKVKIYRTENGGSTLKYVGEVTNGTATFEDDVADGSLGVDIYTTGGEVVENDPPPLAKYVEIVNNVAWWANVKEGSEERTNRVRYSIPGDPDSCPEDYYIDVEGAITSIASVSIYPLVFEQTRIWRFEGYTDSTGHGVVSKKIVSNTIGCINHNSIVKTIYGVFFCSLDGFYFTDGYRVQKLSKHLNDTYLTLIDTSTKRSRIYGKEDPYTGRIYWTFQRSGGNTENDSCFVLDPYWGLTEESCFTTLSGGANFKPTALAFIDGVFHRADSRGYVFKHPITEYNDPVVDTTITPDNWSEAAVIWDLTTVAFNFGTDVYKKLVTEIIALCRNESNLSLQINSYNDNSTQSKPLKEYRFRSNFVWGDEDVIWGDEDVIWNWNRAIYIKRKFPAGGLRCTMKQLQFTNSLTPIVRSDDYGTCTVDATAKTFLLDTAGKSWPSKAVGYYMYVARDGYSAGYEITARTDDTLTVSDVGDTLVDGSQEWLMKGYRKDERFILEAFTIRYEMFGESHSAYQTSEAGTNA